MRWNFMIIWDINKEKIYRQEVFNTLTHTHTYIG